MPKIKRIIKEYFKNCKSKINDEINPDEVVAYGATIQAAMLMNSGKNSPLDDVRLYDITPISLGTDVLNNSQIPKIKALGNLMSVIIPKWTRIPVSRQKSYQTVKDNQHSMQICIYEGENDYLKYDKRIDKLILSNLTEKPKGEVQCIVNFEINVNSMLVVKAYEKLRDKEGISKEIKVTSDNNKKGDNSIHDNNNEINDINMNTIKKNDEIMKNFLKKYKKNSNNNKDKLKVLEKLCNEIRKRIKALNPEEVGDKVNENNIEIYFYNIYQLLECFEEILYSNKDKKKDEEYIKEIKKYINIFKKQSTYYIKQIIDLFKGARNEIFLNIFQYSIEQLNETAKNYLNKRQKFSRYYAKLYFEEIIRLLKKYKKYIELTQFKPSIEEIETNLQNINSNAVSLIYISENGNQLIDSSNKNHNKIISNWEERKDEETLFTYLDQCLNPNRESLSFEDYNLILDELNKIKEITSRKILDTEEGDIKNKLLKEKGICLGNIVKIKFIYQKGKDYKNYKTLIDDSIECGNQCNKNINQSMWYKEAIELQKQIDEKIDEDNRNNNDDIIKIEIQDKLDAIQSCFDFEDKKRFFDSILEEFPYNGFKRQEFDEQFDLERIDSKLINFLSKKYDPNNFQKNTKEEKKNYFIMEFICEKLNSLLRDY